MTLDASVGGESSDSYLTLADALTLAQRDYGPQAAAWMRATDDDRERALRRATEDVDGYVGRVGARWDVAQALVFPRSEDTDDDSDPFLPTLVTRATYFQAAFLIVNAGGIADHEARMARGLKNFGNPDGTSGEVDGSADGMSPRAKKLLGEYTSGVTIGWIETT